MVDLLCSQDVKDGLIESLVDTVTGAGCIRVVEPCTPENQALLKAFKARAHSHRLCVLDLVRKQTRTDVGTLRAHT